MNDENLEDSFLGSVKESVKARLGSVMYGTFAISWCIWNWRSLYSTIFIDQDLIYEKFNQLKLDYILGLYWDSFWLNGVFLLGGPFLSAIFIVWLLSYVDRWFLKKSCKNNWEGEQIKNEYKVAQLRLETVEVKAKGEKFKEEKKLEQEMTNEDRWDIEYENLRKKNNFLQLALKEMYDCLYSRNGDLEEYHENITTYSMSPEVRGYLDLNGLGTYQGDTIKPTEKGRYFLKRFTVDGALPF